MTPTEEVRFLLEYEMAGGDWWASWLPIGWMQSLAGKYFARKVIRKRTAVSRVRLRRLRLEAHQACERLSTQL